MGNKPRFMRKEEELSPYEQICRSRAKYLTDASNEDDHVVTTRSDLERAAHTVDLRQHTFPFENIVLEGGGNKGLAYCGAIRVLEGVGIMRQVKRVGGTSAGAMTAALLAVGYTSHEIETFLSQDLSSIFLDHVCGPFSIPLNASQGYGWNPGKKIVRWFKQKLKAKTKNEDITFKMLYESKDESFIKELCIVVTNVNEMTAEYCHVKTQPHMKIVDAVRMSMSMPGVYQAFKHKHDGVVDVLVDGGMLCNFPIHCFDGWWLSLKRGDSFIERLHPLNKLPELFERKERFGEINKKTLGFVLFADDEQDAFRFELDKQFRQSLEDLSGTKLSDKHQQKKQIAKRAEKEHRKLVEAVEHFLKSVRKHNTDADSSTIVKTELTKALNDDVTLPKEFGIGESLLSKMSPMKTVFPQSDRHLIFGDVGTDVIMKYLDKNDDGKIDYNEMVAFMEEAGVQIQNRFLGYQRKEVNGVMDFISSLICTVITNAKKTYFGASDLDRTIGINTEHVGTMDFKLEQADRDFVIERGRQATLMFLKYYVAKNEMLTSQEKTEETSHVLNVS